MSRSDSRLAQFQQRVPHDLTAQAAGRQLIVILPPATPGGPEEVVSVTIGATAVRFSLRTADPALAKRRQAAALEQMERLWAALRAGAVTLSPKQRVALAGTIYKAWREALDQDPVLSAEEWSRVAGRVAEARRGGLGAELAIPLPDGQHIQDAVDATLERMFGRMADAFLSREGLILTEESRAVLLLEVARAMQEQAEQAAREAGGDYRPDVNALRFPEWTAPTKDTPTTTGGVTYASLFADYLRLVEVRPKTEREYRKTFTEEFAGFIKERGHHDDPRRVATGDVVAWRDKLLADGLSAKTVKDKKLAAVKAVYGRAERDGRMVNPAAKVEVPTPRRVRARERGFTDTEAEAILKAAAAFVGGRHAPEMVAAIRWSPWIGAYTGARIAEITQLRAADFRDTNEGWFIRFTPEAGGIKADQYRDVPVHPHLVDLGLITFVQSVGIGPLFYKPEKTGQVSKRRADTSAGRVSGWVRGIVTDARVQPTHGWRHRFATLARQVGMDPEARAYIQGHALPGMAGVYGDMAGLVAQIGKLPAIKI
ncbi:MAG: site-specific integrase [Proteobacteria bacterium]|nr:site-specific integrase [Pseudomonadota bacterium]